MEFLKDVYEERRKYFEKLDEYLEEIKRIVKSAVPDAKIFLFGSVVKGEYSVGLSDIDIAIISKEFENREKKLEVFGMLTEKFMDSPFEFHLLTPKQWEFYSKFIGDQKRKIYNIR